MGSSRSSSRISFTAMHYTDSSNICVRKKREDVLPVTGSLELAAALSPSCFKDSRLISMLRGASGEKIHLNKRDSAVARRFSQS